MAGFDHNGGDDLTMKDQENRFSEMDMDDSTNDTTGNSRLHYIYN